MSRTHTRKAAHPPSFLPTSLPTTLLAPSSPLLRLYAMYGVASVRGDVGREVIVTIDDPGRYRIRSWTADEWAALPDRRRPHGTFRKGDVWLLVEPATA